MQEIYLVQYSPDGPNSCIHDEPVVMNWFNYLQDCEDNVVTYQGACSGCINLSYYGPLILANILRQSYSGKTRLFSEGGGGVGGKLFPTTSAKQLII